MMKYAVLLFLLLAALPVRGQGVTEIPQIAYDQVVTDTLTNEEFFDWWKINAQQGDIIVVDMQGADGLAPMIGILKPGGDLAACSGGTPPAPNCGKDSPVNGRVEAEYTVEETGPHILVATRQGSADGTTTGSYTLRVRLANPEQIRENLLQEVEFRCKDFMVTTAATLQFEEDKAQAGQYRISIYGLDGFKPVIRVYLSGPDFTDCSRNAQAMAGDRYTLPGEPTVTLDADQLDTAAQLTIKNAASMGRVTLTIGSLDGAAGRYLAVIEGFSIASSQDVDVLQVRLGPLARDTALLVYMIGASDSRLDPFVRLDTPEGNECDDAGRRGCDEVPPITGAGVAINDGVTITGDRFDAGLRLAPGHPDPLTLELSSRKSGTYGEYALLVIGELPPRSTKGN